MQYNRIKVKKINLFGSKLEGEKMLHPWADSSCEYLYTPLCVCVCVELCFQSGIYKIFIIVSLMRFKKSLCY